MSFTTNNLVSYRDEHAMDLIAKLNWAGDSLKFFEKIPGTTNIVTLNYFEVDPVLKFGAFCTTMSATGNTNLYQKDICVADIKAEDSWCPNTLQKYYFTDQLKGVAGDSLGPWEKRFLDEVTVRILKQNETMVWQGNAASNCVGLYKQLSGDTARTTAFTGTTTAANVIANIQLMVNALPNDISQRDDLMLFVSPTIHNYFMQAMFNNNNYAQPLYTNDGDIVINFFGPSIVLHKTYGLAGTQQMYLTVKKNLYHAFDSEADESRVSLWYEQKDDILYYRCKYRMGVNYWLGDYFVTNF